MKPKVVSRVNLPLDMPVWQTITAYLLLDKLQASQVVWGIAIALLAFWWIVAIAIMTHVERVDIFAPGRIK